MPWDAAFDLDTFGPIQRKIETATVSIQFAITTAPTD